MHHVKCNCPFLASLGLTPIATPMGRTKILSIPMHSCAVFFFLVGAAYFEAYHDHADLHIRLCKLAKSEAYRRPTGGLLSPWPQSAGTGKPKGIIAMLIILRCLFIASLTFASGADRAVSSAVGYPIYRPLLLSAPCFKPCSLRPLLASHCTRSRGLELIHQLL